MREIIRRVGHILLLTACVPILLLLLPLIPILNLLGLNKLDAGPDYVAGYLQRFIAGTEGDRDWDDFCSVPLKDSYLDSVREQVCNMAPPNPIGDFERAKLKELLQEVRATGRVEPVA